MFRKPKEAGDRRQLGCRREAREACGGPERETGPGLGGPLHYTKNLVSVLGTMGSY